MNTLPVQTLRCCCCSGVTWGRQWWNQDTGYGLCSNCITLCDASIAAGEKHLSYGVRGYHYDIPDAASWSIAVTDN